MNRIVTKLLLVPLDDIVVFPNMNVTLTVDVGDEEHVLLVPKHEGEYAKVGTVATVTDRIRLPGGGRAVAHDGLHRGVAGAASSDSQGRLFVDVEERPDDETVEGRIRELEIEYRAVVETILNGLSQSLTRGERIDIRGFGSFGLNYRPPRSGRNPKSGQKVQVPAKYVPHFKVGKELRDRIKNNKLSSRAGVS